MSLRVVAHGNPVAAVGQRIVVQIDDDPQTLRLGAPFFRRTIPLADVASAEASPDDGLNHGALNCFVVGRERSGDGVRLNSGGHARVDIATTDQRRYQVVVDTMDDAEQIVAALTHVA